MNIPLHTVKGGPTMGDYVHSNHCWWCNGCGDYGIWTAVKRALVELGIHPWQVCLCYDVGCNGNMSDKLQGYRFHGLHGRVLPFAAGAKLANPRIPVIAQGGDGASFSEGVNHFVHAIRSNYPIVFILHNNENYGLTTGQASSLTPQGQPMNTSPNGIPERTLNAMDFVFSLQPTFIARSFSGDIGQMTHVIKEAIQHNGFAFVDILQACPTWNHFMTHEYLLERCYDVNEKGNYDVTDFAKARKIAIDTSKKISTGILYQQKDVPNFYENLVPRKNLKTVPVDEVQRVNVAQYMKDFI